MRLTATRLLLCLMVVGAGPSSPDPAQHRRDIDAWRERRFASLKRDDGWLTLVGLSWLEPGENSVGSDPRSRVVLPAGKAPERLATITVSGKEATLSTAAGETVEVGGNPVSSARLRSDASGEPTVVRRGPLRFYLIDRGDRVGVRVKDSESPALKAFNGIDSFPVGLKWRVEARVERHDPPKEIHVPNVLGAISPEKSLATLAFDVGGKTYRLDVVDEEGTTDWFVIFGDQTNGHETYGGGRFLYVTPPAPGAPAIVDFNKAYNPPCVFSPYATCPLPPAQNKIAVRIEAGEKNFGDH
ncbi:MAG: DUF1684 domain-containing protein [Acidobacteriota bacterium]|nr:DUF1684 domain-containing protein [Acidobacteriota bacterium]